MASIYNSVELWGFYCSFHSEKFPESVDETRGYADVPVQSLGRLLMHLFYSLFERGIAAVGYDFLSHPLWDKYIAFEETHGTPVGVIAILERVIRIPLHQYARYFEKYVIDT